ncbi:divergent polysaccharide deacetylase family protein [Nitrosophilus kaiyonis]|uniref:divergent polysaccharide deacetylase family protein n=1 Tax=Nitrosophilus kaiyonis TaxID=2930200 RepID=UPI0024908187|nr:divergent polysaccharide deacetylase family protein [Nitrosophilus kaiyonis]
MTKRKKRTKKSSKKSQKKLLFIFLIALVVIASGISGYVFFKKGYEKGYQKASLIAQNKIKQIKKEEKKALQKHLKEYMSEIKDYMHNKIKETKEKIIIQKKKYDKKPKLAIIIDDVAFKYQVDELKSLNIPINLSFFPPNKRHPNTPIYAKNFKIYMIHLPLEAKNFKTPEPFTLNINSSQEEIENRIRKIREWFPNAKYINNHTGSAFTSNYEAMDRLINVLNRYQFRFLDSRTTPDTKVAEVEKKYGIKYLARDIFLDNEQNVKYIKNQLKKAVAIAKKRGFAIAIGHPHPKTIEALRESKDILKDVKLVYINELDKVN